MTKILRKTWKMVHLSAQWLITHQFPSYLYSPRFLRASWVKCRGLLPTTQFTYRKGHGTCDALLCGVHTLQSALEMGQEARMLQINSSALLTGSTIKGFSSSSVLRELEVQCCLFWHSFSLIGHSMSWTRGGLLS